MYHLWGMRMMQRPCMIRGKGYKENSCIFCSVFIYLFIIFKTSFEDIVLLILEWLGTNLTTSVCALPGSWTRSLWMCRMVMAFLLSFTLNLKLLWKTKFIIKNKMPFQVIGLLWTNIDWFLFRIYYVPGNFTYYMNML